eukprot:SAG11_NODE_134_length_15338_cov_3.876435_20_plen_102_part_00
MLKHTCGEKLPNALHAWQCALNETRRKRATWKHSESEQPKALTVVCALTIISTFSLVFASLISIAACAGHRGAQKSLWLLDRMHVTAPRRNAWQPTDGQSR